MKPYPVPIFAFVLAVVTVSSAFLTQNAPTRRDIERAGEKLNAELDSARLGKSEGPEWANAAIYHKAVSWALRYASQLSDGDLQLLDRLIGRGRTGRGH